MPLGARTLPCSRMWLWGPDRTLSPLEPSWRGGGAHRCTADSVRQQVHQHLPIGCPDEGVTLANGAVKLSRDTKVNQLDVSVVCEEHVLPFDVPVDHLALVQVTEALQREGCDRGVTGVTGVGTGRWLRPEHSPVGPPDRYMQSTPPSGSDSWWLCQREAGAS